MKNKKSLCSLLFALCSLLFELFSNKKGATVSRNTYINNILA